MPIGYTPEILIVTQAGVEPALCSRERRVPFRLGDWAGTSTNVWGSYYARPPTSRRHRRVIT